MKCEKCDKEFEEKNLHLSHDIPKYMGGTDADGRHWLCKECHDLYEFEVMKNAFMFLVCEMSAKEKEACRKATILARSYFFKRDKIKQNDKPSGY